MTRRRFRRRTTKVNTSTNRQANEGIKNNQDVRGNGNNTNTSWRRYILPSVLTVAYFVIPHYIEDILNGIPHYWAFVTFTLSSCVITGYWTWLLTNWLRRGFPFRATIRLISTVTVMATAFVTSPYYVYHFISSQGSIEMPTFSDDSQQVLVRYGIGKKPMWTQTTIGELKQKPQPSLSINNQPVFYVHIENNKLFIDTAVFAGTGKPPILIKNNAFSSKPEGWDIYQNNMALEILNEYDLPVLVLEYRSQYEIAIAGLFSTPSGICKVNNGDGDVFVLGDTLPELGEYKVNRVFIRSILDLFRSERTFTFEK